MGKIKGKRKGGQGKASDNSINDGTRPRKCKAGKMFGTMDPGTLKDQVKWRKFQGMISRGQPSSILCQLMKEKDEVIMEDKIMMMSRTTKRWWGMISIYMGTTEWLLNINTDNIITLVKLRESYYCYWVAYKRSTYCSDVYVLLMKYPHFQCRTLQFCLMSISWKLSINCALILFWLRMWCILFNANNIWSDVEPKGYWHLDFGNILFFTRVIQSDFEPPGSWWSGFGSPGSWIMSELVSKIPLLIHPYGGIKPILWLSLRRYLCLVTVWWIGGWCLVK